MNLWTMLATSLRSGTSWWLECPGPVLNAHFTATNHSFVTLNLCSVFHRALQVKVTDPRVERWYKSQSQVRWTTQNNLTTQWGACSPHCSLFSWFWFLETGSHCVAQVGHKLSVLMHPRYWDYGCAAPCLTRYELLTEILYQLRWARPQSGGSPGVLLSHLLLVRQKYNVVVYRLRTSISKSSLWLYKAMT